MLIQGVSRIRGLASIDLRISHAPLQRNNPGGASHDEASSRKRARTYRCPGEPYGIGLHRDTPWCMFVVDVEAVVPMAAELDGAYNTVAYGRLMHFPPITLALIR